MTNNDSNLISLIFCSQELPRNKIIQVSRHLQRDSKKYCFPLLAKFLSECTVALKAELRQLPWSHEHHIPQFQSLLNLASTILFDKKSNKNHLNRPLEQSLLCALQIASLIRYFEEDIPKYESTRRNMTALGEQVGLFAAAAISISRSLLELVSIGTDSVRAAFRLYAFVDQISHIIAPQLAESKKCKSWFYVITGVSEAIIQKEIDHFNSEKHKTKFRQKDRSIFANIRISHVNEDSIIVNGPPSHVENFLNSSRAFHTSNFSPLVSQSGLCHALDIYSYKDIEEILEPLSTRKWLEQTVHIKLLAPSRGMPFTANNAAHLLEMICEEILTRPNCTEGYLKGLCSHSLNSNIDECEILSCGISVSLDRLASDINKEFSNINLIQKDLTHWTQRDLNDTLPMADYSKLAVIGMSCRMPGGAKDPDLLFQLLNDGRDVHTRIPADRFDVKTHYDPTGLKKNASETPFGNFIDNPGFFDASFFNMSPREAEQTDPMHRLALVTAYEALEMSGFSPNRTPSTSLPRVGTFYGVASDDYREVNAGQNIGTYATPGGERAFANGRINYFFKFGGPSINIDTACSSSGAAINAACSSLWAGEIDMAIAGGLNIITNPDNYCMLSKGYFLSKTGQCKVWSKKADGYCRADGIGCIVIKRLEDAIADNDNILATIISAATNHSANAISITHPEAKAQIDNYNQVLQNAGVDPLDVSYIELHGTGTQAGDGVESSSIVNVFAPHEPARKPDNPLFLGAIKSNIGHSEAAAGVASVIKVLLAFQKEQIPRNIGIGNEMNPIVAANIYNRNAHMAIKSIPWPRREDKKRYAVANSFGAHGGNTTFLLEDPPIKVKKDIDPRKIHTIALSAKSLTSLKGNIESLIKYLDNNPKTSLGDLSYTLCARRIHHHIRIATTVTNIPQLRRFLSSFLPNLKNLRPIPAKQTPIVFAFTGQGVFYEGISEQLFQGFPSFRKEVIRLDRVSQKLGFSSIIPIITKKIEYSKISSLMTQITILIVEISLVKFWEQMGIYPSVLIGHSLGEYAALVTAGVLSAADAIYLVGKRDEILIAKCKLDSHHMLSIRASAEIINKIANGFTYSISCLNSPTNTVISGSRDEIEAIQTILEQKRLKFVRLELPFAYHSFQMDPILDPFEKLAENIIFNSPTIPIISPLLARCVDDGNTFNARYLCDATRKPVNFIDSLTVARQMGIADENAIWIEIGPHPICQVFVKSYNPAMRFFSSLHRSEENFTTISNTLAELHSAGLPICWTKYFAPHEKAHNLLNLSHYSWDEKNYWIPYRGTWALDKAKFKGETSQKLPTTSVLPQQVPLATSSVHKVVSDELRDNKRWIVTLSDVLRADFLREVEAHRIKDTGVATTSIWADMAFTIGDYLYRGLASNDRDFSMKISDLKVFHSTPARKDRSKPQLLQVEACLDYTTRSTEIKWYKISFEGVRLSESYATAFIYYEDPAVWKKEWRMIEKFVNDRIEVLQKNAIEGSASRLTKSMVYKMFKNLVEYQDIYQGINSIILDGYEAYSEVTLNQDKYGDWFVPPHYIESVLSVAGFVMSCSDKIEHENDFYLTPGWEDLRFVKLPEPGARLRSYVRMFPTKNPRNFSGDVIVLQDDIIIGICNNMRFRKIPNILMDQFFSPKSSEVVTSSTTTSKLPRDTSPRRPTKPIPQTLTPSDTDVSDSEHFDEPPALKKTSLVSNNLNYSATSQALLTAIDTNNDLATIAATTKEPFTLESSATIYNTSPVKQTGGKRYQQTVDLMMELISRETGLGKDVLTDEASFLQLGVDSLMSLVIAQKFRVASQVEIHDSIFLDHPSIKELKAYFKDKF